jgi:DNA-binding NarL/FixJ family response regulator
MQEILTWSLQTAPGLELAAVADTVTDALAEFERHQPDVVILDLALREGTGLDVLRQLKLRAPACQVLIFTTHDSEPYRARCLTEGADHFFSKNKQHRELVQLLQQLGSHAGSGLNPQPRSDHV